MLADMAMELTVGGDEPSWLRVAKKLEDLATGPTAEQVELASRMEISLPAEIPAPVAAVLLRSALASALFDSVGRDVEVAETLTELENELGIAETTQLVTGSRDELSAWFAARYMLKTAAGLRDLKPEPGDVVEGAPAIARRVVSSVGETGRVYLRGMPTRSAWPNHLVMDTRSSDPGHSASVAKVNAGLLNAKTMYTANYAKFAELDEFKVGSRIPAPEAIRQLEELLESGERHEGPFQKLLERHPELLALTVMGGWQTFVIPQQRLGSEHVTDFLVLGINSVGPQWVAVEIEAPRHKMRNKDGTLPGGARHAVKQIEDWREWLTLQVAYAQGGSRKAKTGLGLYGITNRVSGLVIIGRDDPSSERQGARSQSAESARIDIHSWDWLLRHAKSLGDGRTQYTDFARTNAIDLAGATRRGQALVADPAELSVEDIDDMFPDDAF